MICTPCFFSDLISYQLPLICPILITLVRTSREHCCFKVSVFAVSSAWNDLLLPMFLPYSLTSFKSLLKSHLLNEPIPDFPFKNYTSPAPLSSIALHTTERTIDLHHLFCWLATPHLNVSCKTVGEGLPWWHNGEEFSCQCRGHGFEPWSGKIPHAAEQLSPCATTTEPVLYSLRATTTEARAPRAPAPQQEKPLQ